MITLRNSEDRGRGYHGWLDSRHTFSFADYYDPQHMHFRSLRVLNQDRVQGGNGFPMHPHREYEIISYILEGELEHEDTMGSESIVGAGGAQVISAGTGMAHSEYNPSQSAPVHFLQIWISPGDRQRGQPPVYTPRTFDAASRHNRLCLITSGDGRDGSIAIRQDADVYVTSLDAGSEVALSLRAGRGAYVHVATGSATLNGQPLGPGDGASLEAEAEVRLTGQDKAEVVIFDLA